MTFSDPGASPDPLLWLRADRGVTGGSAAHWDGTTDTQLSAANQNNLKTGDVDFGFACWVRVNSRPTQSDLDRGETHVAGKWGHKSDPLSEWLLCLNSPSGPDQFRFLVYGESPRRLVPGPHSALPGGIQVGRWYFVVAWHDSVTNTLNLSVDGERSAPVPHSGGVRSDWLPFHLGKVQWRDGFPAISMSRAAFFKNPPGGIAGTIDETIATLYAGGVGADAREVAPARLRQWGLQNYWPLEEAGGVRGDIWGGITLADPSGVGSTLSPLSRPAGDMQAVSGWADESSGRAFRYVGPSGGLSWRGDFTRVVSTATGSRLEHDGLVLSGRPSWTMSLASATRFDRAFGLYGESAGPSDDDYLEIRVDHDGVPELAIRAPGGPEVVARASEALAGRRAATAVEIQTVPDPGDGIVRVRCRVDVGDGHPFANGDRVRVRGLGPPYDGYHPVALATPTEIRYVVEGPMSAPALAGARRLPGASSSAGHTLDRRLPVAWAGTEWSVAGWVRKADDSRDGVAGGSGVFAAKDGADARLSSTRPHIVHSGGGSPGAYRLSLPGGPAADFGPAPKDAWVHLAAVRSGGAITLYYDGVAAGSIDVSGNPAMGSTFTGFGFGVAPDLGASLPCLLDNWGIWMGRALTGAEVSALHGGGSAPAYGGLAAGLAAGLSAWYDFDEVSGAGEDATGHGHRLVERGLVPAGEGVGGGIPFASASTSGLVVGSGRTLIADGIPSEAGTGSEYLRHVLTVRRDGGTVSFFRDGVPIGSSAIDPGLVGPASGTSRLLSPGDRLPAPHGSVDHVVASGAAMADDQVAALAIRLSVRTNRTSGVGPLAVLFDATQVAQVDRMAMQDYYYLWAFTRAGEAALHDGSTAPWRGQAYARSTGFFVSQVFEEEGSYDAHLAVVTPPYDRQGRPQPQSCLFAGKVATVDVTPWPETTITYYVSSTHPARGDSNEGTSPDAPLETVVKAIAKVDRPNVRILLRRGDRFPIRTSLNLSYVTGPLLLGSYGDPDADRPTLVASTRAEFAGSPASIPFNDIYDVRISGLMIQDTGIYDQSSPEYCKLVFSGSNARLLLVHDFENRGTHRFLSMDYTSRALVIDRCRLASAGDYLVIGSAAHAMAVTRCEFEANPELHFFRYQNSLRTQMTHCTRNSGRYIYGAGKSWKNLRWETRFSVVTDTYGDLLGYSAFGNDRMGPAWAVVERNRLRSLSGQGDQITIRDNDFSVPNASVAMHNGDSILADKSENWRYYGNRLIQGASFHSDAGTRPLVNEGNEPLGVGTMAAPAIGMAVAAPDAAILAAEGPGAGPEPLRFRWMRRRAGGAGPFEPLAGQTASAVLDLPGGPGAYEYRLDVVGESGAEALGSRVVTLEIPTGRPEQGYDLVAPSPPAGLAGRPSDPFAVSLRPGVDPGGPVSVVPSSDGPGRFDPPGVTLSVGAPSATFRYIPDPDGLGAVRISTTNDAGLVDPPAVTFSATTVIVPPPAEPTTPVARPVDLEPPDVVPPARMPAPGLVPRPPALEPGLAGRGLPAESSGGPAASPFPVLSGRSLAAPPLDRGS
ncbi:LamG domain-containing protein [Tautonia plasticadhaerens]|nr:LamG domain-containing protein [Tautonia plasticadhaerens]